MATGDGLLARLVPSGAAIALDAFGGLCSAARAHGNGIVEISSRGSIQIRGLHEASAPAFATAVGVLGIEASDGIAILRHPLAGLERGETLDVAAHATALRAALATATFAAELAPKISVVLDGGQSLHLDAVSADIRARAGEISGGPVLHVALGGDAATAVSLGAVASQDAAECMLRLLRMLAAKAPRARMRDAVRGEGFNAFRAAVSELVMDCRPPPPRPASEPIGVHPLRSGRMAVGVGLAFGHADVESLLALVEAARRHGASGVRTSPGRALLLIGLPPGATAPFAADAQALGFIVDARDPRRRVIACAGAPICASGQIPARALAPAVADAARALSNTDYVHISGCGKGCAHPAPAPIAVVGRDGACDLYVDGALSCSLPVDVLPDAIAQVARARGA
jgi:precorrin-3B synthase